MATVISQAGIVFRKLLIARYSPQNYCFASDGEALYPPLPKGRNTDVYSFRGATSQKPSKYGWVRTAEYSFTAEEFAAKYELELESAAASLLTSLLKEIATLDDNSPVAGSFFKRGLDRKTLVLEFHKVFFHSK